MIQHRKRLPKHDLTSSVLVSDGGYIKVKGYTAATVRRLIAEAVAAEREACAMVCAGLWGIDGQFTADEFAAAIRARTSEIGKQGGDKP